MLHAPSSDLSADVIFGWKEIPFEPLGVLTGKYPIVKPSDFDEIITRAEDSKIDKKVNCCLAKAPQGAGKTSLSTEVANYYKDRQDTFVLLNSLINIKPADLMKQVVKGATADKLIDVNFLCAIGYDDTREYESSDLSNLILSVLEKIMERHRLGIWIVDEFDTISSSEWESSEERTDFLQFLRNIIDKLASSEKLRERGFLLLMAHTEKSMDEFISMLKTLHGPATERFLGTGAIEIGYTLNEVKQIVIQRLNWARKYPSSGFDPFDERAIESLYDVVNEYTGSRELISFRMFEKSCYLAVKHAVEKGRKTINEELLLDAFERIRPSSPESEVVLSPTTRQNLRDIKKSTPDVFNNSMLEGILKGLKAWETNTLPEISSPFTELVFKENGVCLNQLTFDASRIGAKGKIRTRIFSLSKAKSSIDERDLDLAERQIREFINRSSKFNLSVLVMSDNEILPSFAKKIKERFNMLDDVLILKKNVSNDLVIIGCCTESERDEKRGSFAQYVSPFIDNLLFTSFNDLTCCPTTQCISLFQVLNVCYLADNNTEISNLKTKTFEFTSSSKPRATDFVNLVKLGLAKESTDGYIPIMPKVLEEFEQELTKVTELMDLEKKIPNYHACVDTLTELQIFKNGHFIDLSQTADTLSTHIKEAKDVINGNKPSLVDVQLLKILVKAHENIESGKISKLGKLVVIMFIHNNILRLINRIKEIDQGSSKPTSHKSSGSNARPEAAAHPEEGSATKGKKSHDAGTQTTFRDLTEENILASANDILSEGPLTLRELAQRINPNEPRVKTTLSVLIREGKFKISRG